VSSITLENDRLRVGIAPHYGARVTSLLDKTTGREWISQGGESPSTGEDAIYLGDEGVGWDECFPTVSPWDASATAWGRKLRDHGDLWGRPWTVDARTPTSLTTTYAAEIFRFTRALELDDNTLIARYSVTNLSRKPLPYLWALHSLFAIEDGDRIEIPGVTRLASAHLSLGGTILDETEVSWPGPNTRIAFPLDTVQPQTTNFAGKFYAAGVGGGRARLGQPGQWLQLDWDDTIEHLGIWITYGAWPGPGGHHEVALEPTNASAGTLGEAIAAGAAPLSPGERRDWRVTLTLVS